MRKESTVFKAFEGRNYFPTFSRRESFAFFTFKSGKYLYESGNSLTLALLSAECDTLTYDEKEYFFHNLFVR